jgi:anti-sigma-K factor RskA
LESHAREIIILRHLFLKRSKSDKLASPTAKRKSSQEALMADTQWADLWEEIEHWAFLIVVVALAVEFAALKFGAPYKKRTEEEKTLEIARLTNDAESLRKQNLELEKAVSPRILEQAMTG